MDATARIVGMLSDESPRKRIAAAVVLGELGVKSAGAALAAMARDPLDAIAEPAIEALGRVGGKSAVAPLLEALERKPLRAAAIAALQALGDEALPAIRAKELPPDVRAALLPAPFVLDALRGQPWDVVSKAVLAARAQLKAAPRKQVESFLKKAAGDEPATRAALKVLGWIGAPGLAETFLGAKHSPAVRVEAITALRFAPPSKKALEALFALVADKDALVARAARDTLTVVPLTETAALQEIALQPNADAALWAIERLGSLQASDALAHVVQRGDKARAEAAVRALAKLPGAAPVLAKALADATDESAAQALAAALEPLQVHPKLVASLKAAGAKMLAKSLAVARRQLEPVRKAEPEAWAALLREAARKSKDAARAEALWTLVARSPHGTADDRYALAVLLLKARHTDAAVAELTRLAQQGFSMKRLEKDAPPDARFTVGFRFAEAGLREQAAAILETVAQGSSKIARAAKNKLKLLEA